MFTVAGHNQATNYNYWHKHQMLRSHAQGREESVPSALNPAGHGTALHVRMSWSELATCSACEQNYADENLFVPVWLERYFAKNMENCCI